MSRYVVLYRTYGLDEGDVVHEVSLAHVQRHLAVRRALLEHFEIVHHCYEISLYSTENRRELANGSFNSRQELQPR